MKFKYKYFTAVTALGILFLSGCKRGDDFYTSPNNPSVITPAVALTAIEVSTINTYESDLVKKAMIFSQQNVGSDAQMLQANEYTLVDADYNNSWGQLYQALYSAKDMRDKYGAANPYYAGMGAIIMAMNYGMLTDMWGDVPFNEALGALGNLKATYDPQEVVLKGIVALLDESIVDLAKDASDNKFLPGPDDLIFGGDVKKWTKVAYTLKARYLNRLSKKTTYDPATILDCLSKGISQTDEDLIAIHGSDAASENNWVDFINNRVGYIVASEPFVDSLKLRPTDLRLNAYFDSTGLADVIGSPVAEPDATASPWGPYLLGANLYAAGPDASTPVHLVTFVEAKFIEAEVKARQNDATAFTALNDAIKASCSLATGGVYDGADIATYTAANTNVSRVMYEKWLGLFGSAEPYNDYRRTGFPTLTPNPNGHISVIPQRFPTPSSEKTGNSNAPDPALTAPVWFAQ
jgi:hypothetical protein